MEKIEVDILNFIHLYGIENIKCSKKLSDYNENLIDEKIKLFKKNNIIKNGIITDLGYKFLQPYKVDNAIIMAAGLSKRCLPLSSIIPKGLYKVKGEILIERQINQLKEVGINNIIIVVGYKKEQFYYLEDKYNVKIIENEDYNKYNNIVSVYLAKDYMKNTYLLCSDNYYIENIFQKYEYESFYCCEYSDKFVDEYCITKMDGDYVTEIKRGAEKSWFTIGCFYFDKINSKKFIEYLEKEIEISGTKQLLLDDFHIKHIDEIKISIKKYYNKIYEFDTLDEIIKFDQAFSNYVLEKCFNIPNNVFEKYDNIKKYNSVPTIQKDNRLHLNENLFKPSTKCLDVLNTIEITDLYEYDLLERDFLIEKIADVCKIDYNSIFLNDGSSEVIKTIFEVILNYGDFLLLPDSAWSYYKSISDFRFNNIIRYNLIETDEKFYLDIKDIEKQIELYHPKLVVITTPNMPTGNFTSFDEVKDIVKKYNDIFFLFDEAYWGFSNYEIDPRLVNKYKNIIISRTFSKFYGLANIRIGFGISNEKLNSLFKLNTPLFKCSYISRKIALAALNDNDYYSSLKEEIINIREKYTKEINNIDGFIAFKSSANFIFIKTLKEKYEKINKKMKENNLIIRYFMEDKDYLYIRITICPMDIFEKIIKIFREC